MAIRTFARWLAPGLIVAAICTPAWTAAPSDALMSADTRGFASIANLRKLEADWNQTQMGQLAADEAMKPFIQDLQRQLERKLEGTRDQLGLTIDDLKNVAAGEIGVGLTERKNARAAVVITVDVTGRAAETKELLAKVDSELSKRKAKRSAAKVGAVDLTIYAIPPQGKNGIAREAVFFVHQDVLCATDSQAEAQELVTRFGESNGRLADVKAYQETMAQCAKEAGDLQPEVRWFADPFGYARAARTMVRPDATKQKGKDYVELLQGQGFDAVKGLGGYVNLAAYGSYELLHRTSIYAPPVEGAPNKYKLAMQIMQFPNGAGLVPEKWVPRKLASYRTFNCNLQNAYEHFGTLFDAMAGYDDAFKDVIQGLETDPYGPQIKVKDEFVKHLGTRVTMITDYAVPITTKSERFLFVVEVKDAKAVAAALKKYMESDPNSHKREIAGQVVWEVLPAESDVPELDLAPVGGAEEEGKPTAMSTSAACVIDGKLFVASHFDFLESVLTKNAADEPLVGAADYDEVEVALNQLLPGPVAMRAFVRTDESYRPTYELLRQGKMPESETLLGRVLNRMLTTPEDEDEGILRKQQIDGRQLPHFEMVRRYFSPAGTAIRSDENGWFVVGAILTKQSPQARAGQAVPETEISAIR